MSVQRAYKTNVNVKKQNSRTTRINTETGAYNTKRKNFNSNKIKHEAIAELQDPSVVYMLGGMPTYIHSTEAYFRAGVKVAETEMNKILQVLMREQQSIMQERASYINNRWKEALELLGFEGTVDNAFGQFQIMWTRLLQSSAIDNEYLVALAELNKLKQATTLMNEIQKNINEIRTKINNDSSLTTNEAKVKSFNDQMQSRGFNLNISIDTKGNFAYHGDLEEARKIAKESAVKAINFALQHNSNQQHMDTLLKYMYKKIHKHMINANSINGITDYLSNTEIGTLFELLTSDIIKVIDDGATELADKIGGIILEPVAAEKSGGKTSSITHKTDTVIKLINKNVSQDIIFSIPVSDKTGTIVEKYSSSADNRTRNFIDRFTASINSAHLDFSHIESTAKITTNQQQRIQALSNYVIRNDAALTGQQGYVEPFKEMLVCYIGWLKIVTEIIGNPQDPLEYCMAIRTPNGLYNTADIMMKFIALNNPLDIIKGTHYINIGELRSHFYKRGLSDTKEVDGKNIQVVTDATLSPGMAGYLYAKKRQIIESLARRNDKVNYQNIYNNDLKNVLKNLQVNMLKLPPIKTWFQINLDSIASALNI